MCKISKNRNTIVITSESIAVYAVFKVRMKGLEPPLSKELDPKSSASTNSATSAKFPQI